MKNTFTDELRKQYLIWSLLEHRQNRQPEYSDKQWHALKMRRYRTKKRLVGFLLRHSVGSLDFNALMSRSLHVNWKRHPGVFIRHTKDSDANLQVTRIMRQLMRERK